jgi:hypothetical protein
MAPIDIQAVMMGNRTFIYIYIYNIPEIEGNKSPHSFSPMVANRCQWVPTYQKLKGTNLLNE